MKIRIFETESHKGDSDMTMKVFVDDNDTENPPHCHVRYDCAGGDILGEFKVSLISAEMLPGDMDGFLCEKERDTFAEAMNNRPLAFGFWENFNGTCWKLACGLWDNGIPDDGQLKGKAFITENAEMPDYSRLPVDSKTEIIHRKNKGGNDDETCGSID